MRVIIDIAYKDRMRSLNLEFYLEFYLELRRHPCPNFPRVVNMTTLKIKTSLTLVLPILKNHEPFHQRDRQREREEERSKKKEKRIPFPSLI